MNSDVLTTGLKVSVDWLAFTVKEESMNVESIIEFLGFHGSVFSPAPRGAHGYKSMLNLDDYRVSILSDGSEDMGIHVNIAGSAVCYILENYARKNSVANPFDNASTFGVDDFPQTVLAKFLSDICKIGKIARLDIAIDDINESVYFTLNFVF